MKKLVRYTVYFWYEDYYWDTSGDAEADADERMRYFIEEHNCHGNFINDLARSMDLAGDDICNAGEMKVIESPSEVPKDIRPYTITKPKASQ